MSSEGIFVFTKLYIVVKYIDPVLTDWWIFLGTEWVRVLVLFCFLHGKNKEEMLVMLTLW